MKKKAILIVALALGAVTVLPATPAAADPIQVLSNTCSVYLAGNSGQTSCSFYAQVLNGVQPTYIGALHAEVANGTADAWVTCTNGSTSGQATPTAPLNTTYTRAGLCTLNLRATVWPIIVGPGGVVAEATAY